MASAIDSDHVARGIGEPEPAAGGCRDARRLATAELQGRPADAETGIDGQHPTGPIQHDARFTAAARLGDPALEPEDRDRIGRRYRVGDQPVGPFAIRVRHSERRPGGHGP